jgi:hypothetical protein
MTDLKQMAEDAAKECGFEIMAALPLGESIALPDGQYKYHGQKVIARGNSEEDAGAELISTLKFFLPKLPAKTVLSWRVEPQCYPEKEFESNSTFWIGYCRLTIIELVNE